MAKKKEKALSTPAVVLLTVLSVIALLAIGLTVWLQLQDGPALSFGKKQSSDAETAPPQKILFLPYREEVRAAAQKYGIAEARIYAVIQTESSFRKNVVSSAGAIGLMQMLPSTYEDLCKKRGVPYRKEDLKDPAVNIDFCTEYLVYLYNFFGSWDNAHLAYHAGIGNVRSWLEDPECSRDGKTVDRIPIAATAKYLERINAALDAYTVAIKSADEKETAQPGSPG